MYIIGASGHAKAILDLIEDLEIVKGVFDDDIHVKSLKGFEVISPVPAVLPNDSPYIIAIGQNSVRKKIAQNFLDKHDFLNIIHSSSIMSKSIKIGVGNVIMEAAIIKVDSIIGNHVILNTKASIDHDCIIEDFVHIAPGATLCGGVFVGEGTLIGAGSVILPNIKIGKWCKIAAGSVVYHSVADGQTWIGKTLKVNNS
ncbi:sugar O-acyltransferase, sialic acid O-acetyltransferase NeuD family [Belliella baltica DSM 15883]|uniref:Sugar O-acyltransferase, sialic acid O-acetyltransferase NeuD family n=1 Tax=Belliella baltica (strain DSM 15883 / CIP 108006 / LMG 21964 / BA134) TaxID=866536 RepID=I3Z5Z3_BELBD|nr:NeuD/PglB/VioB family sugar acetyltransferase [Belliella baltica]AFL84661.1 sugar O-acyltransferase, sialic acid O-acetyltransferase NeuD family [Belliella baltica DSM 15883]